MPLTVPKVNASPGFQKGNKFGRQAHYRGYQMYSRAASIRGILRYPNVSKTRFKLPAEIFWPMPFDWDGAKAYVDALCDGEILKLEEIEREHPDFHFSHGEYFQELRVLVAERGPSPGIASTSLVAPSIIPTHAKETCRMLVTERLVGQIAVALSAVAWDGGATTYELACRYRKQPLTRVTISQDGDYEVVEHRVGRYVALGLDPNIYRRFLTGPLTAALPTSRPSKVPAGPGTMVDACPTSIASTPESAPSVPSSAKSDPSSKSPCATGGSSSRPAGPSSTSCGSGKRSTS